MAERRICLIEVLVLCDDTWHPAEVIEKGLSNLKDKYKFVFVKAAKDILTPEYIKKFPVILCCKGNQLTNGNNTPWFQEDVTEVGANEFSQYVNDGGGFVAVHSGNTAREGEPYGKFIGNYFKGHPPRCDVKVKIIGNSPVTKDVNDFVIRDEHYNIDVIAEDADVFCMTYSETGGEQIGGYTRSLGKGRIGTLTPGHILSVWENKDFQKLLTNIIDWTIEK